MKYLMLDNEFTNLKAFDQRMAKLYVEIDENGYAKREIGIEITGNVVHMYPSSAFTFGRHGILDCNVIEFKSSENELSKAEFENVWIKFFKE